MRREVFVELMDSTYEELKKLNSTKGNDYAGDDDALNNFKTAALRVGLEPTQVWGVYFLKHIAAIETFIKDGNVKSEPIEGRVQDAILYLFLLLGLIVEKEQAPSTLDSSKTKTYMPHSTAPKRI